MTLIERVERGEIEAQITRPDPGLVLAGDPVHTTWNVETRGALHCGVWASTPGKWKVRYDEWEYVYIHGGHSIVTDAAGEATHLMMGDSFILRPGFTGTWEVVEPTTKDYVIVG